MCRKGSSLRLAVGLAEPGTGWDCLFLHGFQAKLAPEGRGWIKRMWSHLQTVRRWPVGK